MKHLFVLAACAVLTSSISWTSAAGQQSEPRQQGTNGKPPSELGVSLPADYVIGAEDQLSIVFWRDKELSADVVVRPDGMISVPLLNDVKAAGYTPEQLAQQLVKAASKFIGDPTATVIVRQINSRKVFIVGQVAKPGAYPLVGDMNVLQLIALAGDVLEYADSNGIAVVRKEQGAEKRFKFRYKDVLRGKNVAQNILLKPSDTVIVP